MKRINTHNGREQAEEGTHMPNQTIIYNNGELELNVSITNESIWLRGEDIASLFSVKRPAIVKHIGNIYQTDELEEVSTCSILEQVAKDGKKRKIKYYNLDIGASLKDLGKKWFAFSRMDAGTIGILDRLNEARERP